MAEKLYGNESGVGGEGFSSLTPLLYVLQTEVCWRFPESLSWLKPRQTEVCRTLTAENE